MCPEHISFKRKILKNQFRLQFLFRRYLNGQCRPEEVAELLRHFNLADDEEKLRCLIADELVPYSAIPEDKKEHWQGRVNNALENIRQQINAPKIIPLYKRVGVRIAVVVLIAIGISSTLLVRHYYGQSVQIATNTPLSNKTDFTKYLKLSDGSTVIVKAGSELIYPQSFSGNTRDVTLNGEAYFDIHHDAAHPFIIHTGKITTTVLGTAFDINASIDKVTVTVTRGRVKVADQKKVLAVLAPNQQVVYDVKKAAVEDINVQAAKSLAWAKLGMSFDGAKFGNIIRAMEKRYQTHIRFANPALENCLISATFSGTESLEEVISVLCIARDATYMIKNGDVVIDGRGCN
ncbi:hypothetical protein A9P82_01030 [Arachidicoccus ginsenosidimutans]|nr:hypothetical protein A9P82_01030 [Arachidicoccus sp. BS20]